MHWLSGWILKASEFQEAKEQPATMVNLPGGFVLLAAPEYDDLQKYATSTPPGSNAALIVTRYWGGQGSQHARLWLKGKAVDVLSQDHPINEALHKLGVVRRNDCDEFDTLELERIRSLPT